MGAPDQATQAQAAHYRDLDGLRGIMALLILAYHFGIREPIARWTGGAVTAAPFSLAVDFFFVLSGLVLARSYLGRPRGMAERFGERIFRLLPVHAVVLAFAVPRIVLAAPDQPPAQALADAGPRFLAELTGTIIYVYQAWPRWNGPAWSINVELYIPVLLAALVPALWRSRREMAFGLLALLLAAQGWLTWQQALGDETWRISRGVVGLSLGGVLYMLLEQGHLRVPPTRWFLPLATLVFVALILLCSPVPLLGWAVPLLIAAIVAMGTRSTGLLGNRLFGWLGTISFTLYMVHVPIWNYYLLWRDAIGGGPLVMTALVALAFAAAWLLTEGVEKPGIRLGKRVLGRRRLALQPA